MKRKPKTRKMHFLLITTIAILMIILAYYLTTIPKTSSNLPSPSNLSCSQDAECPQDETCRREISMATNNFFGEYKCRNKVKVGDACETWNNCESEKCSKGVCLE